MKNSIGLTNRYTGQRVNITLLITHQSCVMEAVNIK